ncbi:hypothetical protein HGM15179_020429 [Zosterops borbonicus]|uniref:Uncharacterized protein n=1 Tax=Zosterops borbonicus TaxID=364589 RepID=A0A8K1D9R3_9PASS|nr:hypothetical protein HGM15179_020429 [Zosterops borbonicus]
MEQILLETMLRHMENKGAIGDNQHDFAKGKSCLSNLVAFYHRVTVYVDERRVSEITYLDLCKALAKALKELQSTAGSPSGVIVEWNSSEVGIGTSTV